MFLSHICSRGVAFFFSGTRTPYKNMLCAVVTEAAGQRGKGGSTAGGREAGESMQGSA